MCGAVKVTIPDLTPDKTSAYCHCLNCKKQSGASTYPSIQLPRIHLIDVRWFPRHALPPRRRKDRGSHESIRRQEDRHWEEDGAVLL